MGGSDDFLVDTLRSFAKGGVDFVVCGGVACVLQGCDRTTMDIDLALSLDEANLRRFVHVAESLGLRPRAPVPLASIIDPGQRQVWIRDKGAMVFTLQSDDGLVQVDVFLAYPVPWDSLNANSSSASLGDDVVIKVSSVEHLIVAKESVDPPRPRDLADLAELRGLL